MGAINQKRKICQKGRDNTAPKGLTCSVKFLDVTMRFPRPGYIGTTPRQNQRVRSAFFFKRPTGQSNCSVRVYLISTWVCKALRSNGSATVTKIYTKACFVRAYMGSFSHDFGNWFVAPISTLKQRFRYQAQFTGHQSKSLQT